MQAHLDEAAGTVVTFGGSESATHKSGRTTQCRNVQRIQADNSTKEDSCRISVYNAQVIKD